MNVTISFEIGYEDSDELFTWLDAAMNGTPIRKKRKRKPMTDDEKKAFRERMLKGQEEAANRRKAEGAKKSKPTAKKKPATKKSTKRS